MVRKNPEIINRLVGDLAISAAVTGTTLAAMNYMGDKMLGGIFGIERNKEDMVIKQLSHQIFELSSRLTDVVDYYDEKIRRERTKIEELKQENQQLKEQVETLIENAKETKTKNKPSKSVGRGNFSNRKPGRPKKKAT